MKNITYKYHFGYIELNPLNYCTILSISLKTKDVYIDINYSFTHGLQVMKILNNFKYNQYRIKLWK